MASQRDRLINLTQPTAQQTTNSNNLQQNQQLPLAYRMRGFDNSQPLLTTISPQMYSTIDYVNVNANAQQRSRSTNGAYQQQLNNNNWQPLSASSVFAKNNNPLTINEKKLLGVKLVCDIDQVFPVPEVSIYRLGKLDGSHPDKLAKLDTRIDRNPTTGLYHVQVISLLDDNELQMKYGLNEPIYFECLIALTNLELGKYADNKRSIVYIPGKYLVKNKTFDNLSNSNSDLLLYVQFSL